MHSEPVRKTDAIAQQKPTKVAEAFRELRAELVSEGWFERDAVAEVWVNALIYAMLVGGTLLAPTYPLIAILLIGVAMQQTGWLAHDYVHGRGEGCWYAGRLLGGLVNGFSSEWWSNKHNTHHAFPNYMGIDTDIQNDPVFHLWLPKPSVDTPIRAWQHWYFFPVVSFLYVSWRIQSFQHAWARKQYRELALMAVNYAWLLFVLPWAVSIGAVLLGGFLVGIIVTVTHQSEEIISPLSEHTYCFVTDQFLSTRDVETSDPIMEYLWGGMQYQLEHHLLPTMPRYKYQVRFGGGILLGVSLFCMDFICECAPFVCFLVSSFWF
jgi:fatty acid desaturase